MNAKMIDNYSRCHNTTIQILDHIFGRIRIGYTVYTEQQICDIEKILLDSFQYEKPEYNGHQDNESCGKEEG